MQVITDIRREMEISGGGLIPFIAYLHLFVARRGIGGHFYPAAGTGGQRGIITDSGICVRSGWRIALAWIITTLGIDG